MLQLQTQCSSLNLPFCVPTDPILFSKQNYCNFTLHWKKKLLKRLSEGKFICLKYQKHQNCTYFTGNFMRYLLKHKWIKAFVEEFPSIAIYGTK